MNFSLSDSFFKRLERYYCVLNNDQLLMYRNEKDHSAQKVINLKGKIVEKFIDKFN